MCSLEVFIKLKMAYQFIKKVELARVAIVVWGGL